jgi:hypothetical protein
MATVSTPLAGLAPTEAPAPSNLDQVMLARQMFWHNVVREMLTGLSAMGQARPELFDGRMAILTQGGERIPIGEVFPMFACALIGTPAEREASVAVECTVFRVRTPGGEVFTLPLHEIRALHTLTPELVKQLEQESLNQLGDEESPPTPFGLAAFKPPARQQPPPTTPTAKPPG